MSAAGPAPDAGTVVADLVARVVAVSPRPAPVELAVVAAVVAAVVLWPATWRPARHGVTIMHEAGHGVVAALAGRRLAGIQLHSDTSGLTVSVGRPRGPGMVLTLLAGYPAPSVAGLLVIAAVTVGHAALALWGALLLLALVLVQIRNWYGLWTVLVAGVGVGAATWLLDPVWQGRIATGLGGLLLLGGLRAALELQRSRRRDRGRASDADQLARVTGVPALLWVAGMVLLSAAALASAVALLLPRGG